AGADGPCPARGRLRASRRPGRGDGRRGNCAQGAPCASARRRVRRRRRAARAPPGRRRAAPAALQRPWSRRVTPPLAIAVDGGNSKTDLALVRADGAVLALARGPLGSPHHIGVDGCVRVLDDLLGEALAEAGLRDEGDGPVADLAELLVAGVDFPAEEQALEE